MYISVVVNSTGGRAMQYLNGVTVAGEIVENEVSWKDFNETDKIAKFKLEIKDPTNEKATPVQMFVDLFLKKTATFDGKKGDNVMLLGKLTQYKSYVNLQAHKAIVLKV